jgi:aldehyde dehydrogenase (NAD+)
MSLADDVKAPIRHADRFFIGGQWVQPSSEATIKVIDSGTEELFFSVAEAQAADISRAVEAAREAFDSGPWPRLTHSERAGILRAIGAELARRSDDLGQIWPRESGVLHAIARFGGAGAQAVLRWQRRASWNVMKPRFQCVLTQWKPGFSASGGRPMGVQQRADGLRASDGLRARS